MRNRNFTKYVFIVATVLCFSTARSQNVPGSAFPVAGDIFSLTEADTAGVSPGAGGSGVTWHFGSLVTGFGSQLDSFMAPSATPYGGIFPNATVAVHEIIPISGTNYYVFYHNNVANSVYERVGNVKPDTVIYTNPAEEFPYPLTSTTTFSGSYYAHYHIAGGSATEAGVGSGSVDGTGTLILPTGTYSNVLRVHSSRTENDTTYTSSTDAAVQVDDYYEWYQANAYFPILSIHYSTISVMGFTVYHTKTVGYRAGYNGVSGINQLASVNDNGLIAFPNPSTDKVTVTYNKHEAGQSVINIYDLTGRMLQSITHGDDRDGMQLVQLDVSQLPHGMYEVSVLNSESSSTVKLQIIN